MRAGPFSRCAIRAIERYRRWGNGRYAGRCRFDPSCSTFALEAFRSRAFAIALPSTLWRIVRCNPLASRSRDPVGGRRRRRRPNGLATAFTLLSLAGLFIMIFSAVAFGQGVSGGCSATVNGSNPASLTRNNPLLVSSGQSVSVRGTIPPSVANPNQVVSNTTITVSIVEGVGEVESSDHPGNGPSWGGSVVADDYLKWSTGLYLVEGFATGTGGWSCVGSGYVKLDGNPFTKPVAQAAGGLAVAGGIGALASSSPRRRTDGPSADEVKDQFGHDVDSMTRTPTAKRKKLPWYERDLKGNALVEAGCMFFLIGPLGMEKAAAAGAAVAMRGGSGDRVWLRGHTAWGLVSGLVLGIGIAVLGQQFALWPLTILTAIAFPVYAAILCGIRARIGRPYRRTTPPATATPPAMVTPPSPTPPAPPPAAPPMPGP